MSIEAWVIDIDRDDIRRATITTGPLPEPGEGEVLVAIDDVAMTANNITYAVFGKPSGLFGPDGGYWDFFADRDAPGRLPVWGFATVVASRADGIEAGTRLYGYYPLASHALLQPGKSGAHGFTDATPRRVALPPIYNQYQAIDSLGDYRPRDHDYWPVFRPLFLTGWLIADQFEDEQDYGVEQILIASASSKTAIGLAHSIKARGGARPRTIGLTSGAHVREVEALGLYDRVVAYDAIDTLDPATPSALVDMAGSGAVTAAVHRFFGDALKASIVVGKSHWDAASGDEALPGPVRQGFFAPGRSQKRAADWGPAELGRRIAEAWIGFIDVAHRIATIDKRSGADGALDAYHEVLDGRADPRSGIVIAP